MWVECRWLVAFSNRGNICIRMEPPDNSLFWKRRMLAFGPLCKPTKAIIKTGIFRQFCSSFMAYFWKFCLFQISGIFPFCSGTFSYFPFLVLCSSFCLALSSWVFFLFCFCNHFSGSHCLFPVLYFIYCIYRATFFVLCIPWNFVRFQHSIILCEFSVVFEQVM